MKKKYETGIIFKHVHIEQLSFERLPDHKPGKIAVDIEFNTHPEIDHEKKTLKVRMQANLFEKGENAPFRMQIGLCGEFAGEDIDRLKDFAVVQAPALLFPFLRETIASITLRGGFPALLLPPTNIQELVGKPRVNKKKAKSQE